MVSISLWLDSISFPFSLYVYAFVCKFIPFHNPTTTTITIYSLLGKKGSRLNLFFFFLVFLFCILYAISGINHILKQTNLLTHFMASVFFSINNICIDAFQAFLLLLNAFIHHSFWRLFVTVKDKYFPILIQINPFSSLVSKNSKPIFWMKMKWEMWLIL